MLRLTLRSPRDGRFLARVVDAGGYPFVLDFGDRDVIADVSRRLQHGFTMWRYGELLDVAPQEPELLRLLADHYVSEGVLVFFEEPGWAGREHSLEDRLPGPETAADDDPFERTDLLPRPDLNALLDDLTEDDSTELIGISELAPGLDPPETEPPEDRLGPLDLPEPNLRGPDEETELTDVAELRRRMAGTELPDVPEQTDDDVIVIDD